MSSFVCRSGLVSRLLSLAILLVLAGCATAKYGEFEPKQAIGGSSPDAYAGYGAATKHHEGYAMAYEWQKKNTDAVVAATRPEVLASFVASDAAADALLAKIGTSYDGDPLVLTQIAAVTQLVMCPKCPKAPARRALWVAALKRARASTEDGYVRTFCDQQLRVCE